MTARAAPRVVAAAGILLAWWIGVRGIDFGRHWDEPRLLQAMGDAAAGGTVLPGWYNYPSLSFDVILAAATTEAAIAGAVRGDLPDGRGLQSAIAGRAHSPAFLLRVRTLFLTLTLLGALWAGAIAKLVTGSDWTATCAALLVAWSWEVGYHARWIAPDGLVMQFGAMTLWLAIRSRGSARRGAWLLLATAAAALTFSSKYTGGVVFLPVLALAAFDGPMRGRVREQARLAASVCVLFVMLSVVATPGFVLDPRAVLRDIEYERQHYGVLGHYGHSTLGWSDHATLIARYLATAVLSPWRPVAVFFATAGIAGIAILARRRPADAAVLLSAPLLLAAYLSTQRAMVARNLLLLVPPIAVFCAIALGAVMDFMRRAPAVRPVVAGGVAIALLANAAWGVHAAQTIRHRAQRDEAEQLRRLLESDPRPFAASPRAAVPASPRTPTADEATWLIMMSSECDWSVWPANRVRYELLPSGPFDVNWVYYPGWWGDARTVLVPPPARAWTPFARCLERLGLGGP